MANYARLTPVVTRMSDRDAEATFTERVVPLLVDAWLDDYEREAGATDIVETTTSGFSYLFDIASGRLIAAWGMSRGRHADPRDANRMRGHPQSAGPHYHRGHAIPHTLGGPTDINLVPQRGAVNIGPFRELERLAVATPGSLYFSHWRYGDRSSQVPTSVEQGLLIPGRAPELRTHSN